MFTFVNIAVIDVVSRRSSSVVPWEHQFMYSIPIECINRCSSAQCELFHCFYVFFRAHFISLLPRCVSWLITFHIGVSGSVLAYTVLLVCCLAECCVHWHPSDAVFVILDRTIVENGFVSIHHLVDGGTWDVGHAADCWSWDERSSIIFYLYILSILSLWVTFIQMRCALSHWAPS